MILSMLFKATAEEVRFIFIDPKMLELSVYEGIPHLLTPVVTDMKDAANALRWCVAEMERRYRLMSALGVRNLRSEEHTSELQSLMRNSYAVFCLKKKSKTNTQPRSTTNNVYRTT